MEDDTKVQGQREWTRRRKNRKSICLVHCPPRFLPPQRLARRWAQSRWAASFAQQGSARGSLLLSLLPGSGCRKHEQGLRDPPRSA